MKVTVYGCRGSVAISRPGSKYGGNTSCIAVTSEAGGTPQTIYIDAGSGMLTQKDTTYPFNILVSHLHLDHIVALGMLPPAWNPAMGVRIYTCSRDARPLKEQVCGIFTPPNWPKALTDSTAVECMEIAPGHSYHIGVFTVKPFLLEVHPNTALAFHITDGKKTLVHLLDGETPQMTPEEAELLASYCKGADIVVFDAAYNDADYATRVGWGHSRVKDGIALARQWECAKMLFAHFDQKYSDDDLDSWREQWRDEKGTQFFMAQDGMELEL